MSYWGKLEEFEAIEIAEGVKRKVFYCERMMIVCFEIEQPPMTFPMHKHEHEQLGFVLQGKAKFTIGDETKIIEKNTFYKIPSNVEHGAEILGPEKAIFIDIFSPIREDFLEGKKPFYFEEQK
ncbi:MAG: cupin domain-containing protein [Promethearchaeota archaeon]